MCLLWGKSEKKAGEKICSYKPVFLAMLMQISNDGNQWAGGYAKRQIWCMNQYFWYYSILHAFNVRSNRVLHNITQFYMDILLNMTCILSSIQFNNTDTIFNVQYSEYCIQYYSILHAYWVVFKTMLLNIWFYQHYLTLQVILSKKNSIFYCVLGNIVCNIT